MFNNLYSIFFVQSASKAPEQSPAQSQSSLSVYSVTGSNLLPQQMAAEQTTLSTTDLQHFGADIEET